VPEALAASTCNHCKIPPAVGMHVDLAENEYGSMPTPEYLVYYEVLFPIGVNPFAAIMAWPTSCHIEPAATRAMFVFDVQGSVHVRVCCSCSLFMFVVRVRCSYVVGHTI
jgi:hypothetical protein